MQGETARVTAQPETGGQSPAPKANSPFATVATDQRVRPVVPESGTADLPGKRRFFESAPSLASTFEAAWGIR